jgi:CRP-like cAMP-binding protein
MLDFLELDTPRLTDLISSSVDEQLRDIATPFRYQAGQLIHHRGDDKPGISIVRAGVVKVGNIGSDGSFVATTELGPGRYFGELTLLLGSSNGRTFDRIGLIADPYVAGSYAEGPYDVTVPITQAVLDAVKPAYKEAFSLGR